MYLVVFNNVEVQLYSGLSLVFEKFLCKTAWTNCLCPSSHFTNTWQLVGHF